MATKKKVDDTPTDQDAVEAQIRALIEQRIQAQGDAKTALIEQIQALRAAQRTPSVQAPAPAQES